MNIKKIFTLLMLCSLLIHLPVAASKSQRGSDEYKEHESLDAHKENALVSLSAEQIQSADIEVKRLHKEAIRSVIKAPGEVRFNSYKTAAISPRISAQVINCYVELGETVRTGQPIVSLSSVEMADAQGALLVADREWKRVKKLGRKVVSESRYTEAKVNWELAKGKVRAYGMNEGQIRTLLVSEDFSRANGRFELVATHDGVVLRENYIIGQQVDTGHELIRITDESSLWVVANVAPSVANQISIGNKATVHFDGQMLPAKVIQRYHSLDETTRTSGIRLAIENKNDALHPGMFVSAHIETSLQENVFVLPERAVLRIDGEWIVMVQTITGKFEAQEVEVERVINERVIVNGIKDGSQVVVKGSFFVWSESAKAGFSDDD